MGNKSFFNVSLQPWQRLALHPAELYGDVDRLADAAQVKAGHVWVLQFLAMLLLDNKRQIVHKPTGMRVRIR